MKKYFKCLQTWCFNSTMYMRICGTSISIFLPIFIILFSFWYDFADIKKKNLTLKICTN